ncbi:MAG: hypothetical protein HFH58_10245 [Lachnospiraceae bacterium]|jgi:D-methionine transport system substrate-binding protein|nr:hypothetical protein [Lachnospiraceae bacterium]
MKKKILMISICAIMISMVTAGCGQKKEEQSTDTQTSDTQTQDKKELVIGTSSVSVELAESGIESLEEMGYTVELKVFDDYFLPNEALVEGSIDANFYQHKPFLDTYNEEKGTEIQMLEPALWNYWSGIYSVKADSIEELPDDGLAGIAEDASNIDLDLKRMQEAGLIKLTDEEKDLYDIADVAENPHNYEFVQADSSKYVNMEDYTLIIGTSNTMAEKGVDPTQNLLQRFVDDSLALGMCIMPENADTQWAKDLMEAYTSDAAKEYVKPETGFDAVF